MKSAFWESILAVAQGVHIDRRRISKIRSFPLKLSYALV